MERVQQPRQRPGVRLFGVVTVGVLAGAVAGYWATCSLLIHRSFHSNGWDLGLVNQVLWNSAHGRLFEYSFRDISFAGDHWEPFLLVLVPLKWLHSGPEGLLIVQAIPLYAAARPAGYWRAAALAGAYLVGLGAAHAVSFDFHVEAFAPLLAFAALWGLTQRRRGVFVISALLILTLKEDGALLALAVCWVAWLGFGERKPAAAVAVAALAYGLVATTVIIPHFRGADLNPFAERYGYLGDSPPEALWGIVAHPNLVVSQLARWDAVEAVALLMASVALLPLLVPRLLPPLVVVVLLPLLSKDSAQGALEFQYLLVPSTVALVITVVALREREWEWLRSIPGPRVAANALARVGLWVAALLAVSATLWLLRSPLPPSFATDWERFDVDHHAGVARGFVREVPPNAVVSAQSPFVPHVSEREDIYQFPRLLDAEVVLLDEYGPIPVDDLVAGYAACLAALRRLGFDEVRREDGISLWRKARPAESVPDVPVACSGQRPQP